MAALKLPLIALLSSIALTGCVSQRYMGVQISSTEPMSITRVTLNGNAVVICRAGSAHD